MTLESALCELSDAVEELMATLVGCGNDDDPIWVGLELADRMEDVSRLLEMDPRTADE